MAVTYEGAGTLEGGAGTVTPGLPVGWAVGDVLCIVCESQPTDARPSAAGYQWVTTPTSTGTGTTRITILWKRAEAGETAPTVSDPGDHVVAQILAFRGIKTTGVPWNDRSDAIGSGTSFSVPAVTTTVDGCLVATFGASGTDTTVDQFSSFTNASLAGFAELLEGRSTAGNGGGFAVAAGTKTTAGACDATTATIATSSLWAGTTLAFQPAYTPVGTITILDPGLPVDGSVSVLCPLPDGVAENDIILIVGETPTTRQIVSVGYASVTGSPIDTGGGTGSTVLTVLWKRAGAGEADPTLTAVTDIRAQAFAFRGVVDTGDPWDVVASDDLASESTAVAIPGATTTLDGCLIVACVAQGTASERQQVKLVTLDGLTEIDILGAYSSGSGNGGGYAVVAGYKATAGNYGATDAVLEATSLQSRLGLALEPVPVAPGGGGNRMGGTGAIRKPPRNVRR